MMHGVMMVRVAFEAGAVGAAHSHPHVQCSLVEQGVFDITIAGCTERLRHGDSFLVPSNAVHGAVAVEAGVAPRCIHADAGGLRRSSVRIATSIGQKTADVRMRHTL